MAATKTNVQISQTLPHFKARSRHIPPRTADSLTAVPGGRVVQFFCIFLKNDTLLVDQTAYTTLCIWQ